MNVERWRENCASDEPWGARPPRSQFPAPRRKHRTLLCELFAEILREMDVLRRSMFPARRRKLRPRRSRAPRLVPFAKNLQRLTSSKVVSLNLAVEIHPPNYARSLSNRAASARRGIP